MNKKGLFLTGISLILNLTFVSCSNNNTDNKKSSLNTVQATTKTTKDTKKDSTKNQGTFVRQNESDNYETDKEISYQLLHSLKDSYYLSDQILKKIDDFKAEYSKQDESKVDYMTLQTRKAIQLYEDYLKDTDRKFATNQHAQNCVKVSQAVLDKQVLDEYKDKQK